MRSRQRCQEFHLLRVIAVDHGYQRLHARAGFSAFGVAAFQLAFAREKVDSLTTEGASCFHLLK